MEIVFEHGTDPRLAGGYTQVPNCVLRSPKLAPKAKLVYAILLSYAWQAKDCLPSYERMCKDLGMTEPTVRSGLKQLRKEKLIDWKQRGRGKTNVYIIKALNLQPLSGKTQNIFGSRPKENDGSRPKKSFDPSLEKDSVKEHPEEEVLALFERFWSHAPRKSGKADAKRVFLGKAKLKDGSKMTHDDRLAAIESMRKYGEIWARAPRDRLQFRKMPAGWLRDRRWEDDPADWENTAGVTGARQPVSSDFQTDDDYDGGRPS